jgi:hypothetical protein
MGSALQGLRVNAAGTALEYAAVASIVFTDKGNWATTTAYVVGDMVTQSNARYLCATAHTSGTFATDLTAAKWVLADSPTAATQTAGDSSTKLATTAFVTGGMQVMPGTAPPPTLLTNKNLILPVSVSGSSQTNAVQTQALLQLIPMLVVAACTVASISINVAGTPGSAGSVVRIGIYKADKTLVIDGGTVVATSSGTVTVTLNQALTPGMYYVALAAQGAPSTTRSCGPRP